MLILDNIQNKGNRKVGPFPKNSGNEATPNLVVDQTGYGLNPLGVVVAVISIGLGQTLVATKATIGVFNNNTTARESSVIGNIFGRTGFATRLLARTKGQV